MCVCHGCFLALPLPPHSPRVCAVWEEGLGKAGRDEEVLESGSVLRRVEQASWISRGRS